MNSVALLLTHRSTPETDRSALRFIHDGLGPERTRVLFDVSDGATPSSDLQPHAWCFDGRDFNTWGYSTFGNRLVPGHAQLPVLRYFEEFPFYDYYWVVEYDVFFRGLWRDFFGSFGTDPSDLLACHLRRQADEPDWWWWPSLHFASTVVPSDKRIRSLLMVARYSRNALATVIEYQRAGWSGHFEGLVPTIVACAGLTVSDIGGAGPFTPTTRRGRNYSSYSDRGGFVRNIGSLRVSPPMRWPGIRRNFLYHPVKPDFRSGGLSTTDWCVAAGKSVADHLKWRFGRV